MGHYLYLVHFWKPTFLTVPRQPGVSNNLFEILEIERGITADEFEANDDPGNDQSPVWGPQFRIAWDLLCLYTIPRTPGSYASC